MHRVLAWGVALALTMGCHSDSTLFGGNSGAGGKGQDTTSSGESCERSPCKLTLPQCGCSDSEMCTAQFGTIECTPIPADPPGWSEACTNVCAPGLMCVAAGDGGPANCQKLCEDDSDCSGSLCAIPVPTTDPDIKACTVICDVVTSEGCPVGAKCTAAQEMAISSRWYSFCTGAGMTTHGGACDIDADCALGNTCVEFTDSKRCTEWCQIGVPSCPPSTLCTSLDPPLQVRDDFFGLCL